jgi:hypothetical protein
MVLTCNGNRIDLSRVTRRCRETSSRHRRHYIRHCRRGAGLVTRTAGIYRSQRMRSGHSCDLRNAAGIQRSHSHQQTAIHKRYSAGRHRRRYRRDQCDRLTELPGRRGGAGQSRCGYDLRGQGPACRNQENTQIGSIIFTSVSCTCAGIARAGSASGFASTLTMLIQFAPACAH